ncbi:LLM class flavin-dependent oxidoreductase [Nocardia exalbida]|uniref:LLM class flavin-dependent oxidoreductase n=1 Tax=Nocardia exalbida TaxID=290231 RepID=UPI0002E03704|nr:LLM class flavin-dependent oxidoreductase [Nocardia exalbida]
MPALHDDPGTVKVTHQYGLGIHDTAADSDCLDPGWQRRQLLEYLDFAVEAEELGYDGLTLTEHHVPRISNPSPHLLLANVAARTNRIRLGTAITVLPLYNPVRVAEEAGMLDLLSDGRFELGIGRGNPVEYEMVTGHSPARSGPHFSESCELLDKALTTGDFTFDGEFHRRPRPITVTPDARSVPVWMAAQSDFSVDYAAGKGWNLLRNFGDNQTHRAAFDRYLRESDRAGYSRSGANFMVSQFVCLGATETEAEQSRERLLEVFSGLTRPTGPVTDSAAAPHPPIVCGTPDQVLDTLQRTVIETGARRLMIEAISRDETRVFAKEVLPALRAIPISGSDSR